jgi:hypothetical protein
MENKSFTGKIIGVAISLAALFGIIYLSSKAWKSGQK